MSEKKKEDKKRGRDRWREMDNEGRRREMYNLKQGLTQAEGN